MALNKKIRVPLEAKSEIKADFCVKAVDESMNGFRIRSGDTVFIQAQKTVENGEIAAVVIDDEIQLRRFYYYPQTSSLTLIAGNPAYAPLVYTGEEMDEIEVLGKAVFLQTTL